MKNKKGFTILEIIVCITLMILIGTIISSLILRKKDNENGYIKEINQAADVFFDSNIIDKEIFKQNNEIYIKVSKLIDKGLLSSDYEKHENKCVHLTEEEKGIKYDEELSNICLDLPYIEEEIELEEKGNVLCYESEEDFPISKIKLHLNNNTFKKFEILIDGITKVSYDTLEDVPSEYQIQPNEKNITYKLTYIINNTERTLSKTNSKYYILDNNDTQLLYNEGNFSVEPSDRLLKIEYSTNDTDYQRKTLEEIKSIEGNKYIKLTDVCQNTKKYKYTKESVANNISADAFPDSGGACPNLQYAFKYVFPNGNILYTRYHEKDCSGGYPYTIYIYNPRTFTKAVVLSIYADSSIMTKDVKIEKIDGDNFYVYVNLNYNSYYWTYSNIRNNLIVKYIYNNKENTITELERVERIIDADIIYGVGTKHYCKYEYKFNFGTLGNITTSHTYQMTSEGNYSVLITNSSTANSCYDNTILNQINNKSLEYKNLLETYNNVVNYNTIEYTTTIEDDVNYFRNAESLKKFKNEYFKYSNLLTSASNYYVEGWDILKNLLWEKGNNKIIVIPKKDTNFSGTVIFTEYTRESFKEISS